MRDSKAERLGGFQVYEQIKFSGLLDGKVSWFYPLEERPHVGGCPAIQVLVIRAIADQCASRAAGGKATIVAKPRLMAEATS